MNSRLLPGLPGTIATLVMATGNVPVLTTLTVLILSEKILSSPKKMLFGFTVSCANGGLTVIEHEAVAVSLVGATESVTRPVNV